MDELPDKRFRVPGVYEAVLSVWCRHEVTDPVAWLEASGNEDVFVEYERKTTVLADLLFDERFGEPVEAWFSRLGPYAVCVTVQQRFAVSVYRHAHIGFALSADQVGYRIVCATLNGVDFVRQRVAARPLRDR